MEPLLAKSAREGRDPKTLLEHTTDVVAAVNALFTEGEGPSRLGRAWLRFFGLGEEEFGRFLKHLRVAAVLHDWGKANDGFQDAVKENGEQVVRHEHLSALILADLLKEVGIQKWLEGAGIDHGVVMAAVVSHHAKAGAEGSDNLVGEFVGLREILRLAAVHPDFQAIWKMVGEEIGSACPTQVDFGKRWATGLWRKADIEVRRTALRDGFGGERKKLRQDEGRRKLLAAVRAGLIVADAVGSAVVRMPGEEGEESRLTIERWVRRCFERTLTGQEVWEKVVKSRIADLRGRGRWDDTKEHIFGDERGFNAFQCEVAELGPRVLMMAPCGAGKTLAAWNWITAQLNARPADRPIARVLFLYPTRATATEGFRDYVSWAPEDDAGLMSGTADYDLQGMFTNPPDGKGDERGVRNYQSDPRLYALGNWSKRIFSATADQFFPFLQYGYGPLCGLPLLAESIVVVDEAHSFDESMFATLKRFLTAFPDVPVLCMTATLPANRRADLVDRCGMVPYPETTPPDMLADSAYDRYYVQWIDREDAERIALGSLAKRERVLWVSNRVADCQRVFAGLKADAGGAATYCYHSRFKLEDRRERHNKLVQEFQKAAREEGSAGILGATTQVCEMSLDLDAQVLITECAPIASLIQRMGRCNRDSEKMRARPAGRVYVIRPTPGKEKPYEKEELKAAERFVSELAGKLVSQDRLEEAYRLCDPLKVETDKHTPFLDSGPFADGTEATFREGDEFTVPCVLDRDLDAVKQAIERREPIDAYTVPVPRRFARPLPPDYSRLPRWLSVASSDYYDRMTGFGDQARGDRSGGDL